MATELLRSLARTALAGADALHDLVLARRARARGAPGTPVIVPYVGHAFGRRLSVSGRVLLDAVAPRATPEDSRWRNLVNSYRLFASRVLGSARVRAEFRGEHFETVADVEGYYAFEVELANEVDGPAWQHVALEALRPRDPESPDSAALGRAHGAVLVHRGGARFGVVSDVDDTIVHTGVTSEIRMMLTVLTSNAHTRLPFAGVAAFYRALQRGCGDDDNPIFYVSNGPWNLYAVLIEFFRIHGIPLGPLYLRDFGPHVVFPKDPPGSHKLERVERILAQFSHLPFILIGDSGEHDPEIYAEIARRHPQRVLAIYIRNVDRSEARLARIDALTGQLSQTRAQLLLVSDSAAAAAHAAGEGWIAASALPAIREEMRNPLSRRLRGAAPASIPAQTPGERSKDR